MNLKYVIIIFLLPLCCIGQGQKKIDSLKTLISKSKTLYDEGKLDSFNHYAKISYNLAKVFNADSLQVEIVGTLSFLGSDLKKALSYLAESEPIAIRNKQFKSVNYRCFLNFILKILTKKHPLHI